MLKTSTYFAGLENPDTLRRNADMFRKAGFEAVDAQLFTRELVDRINSGSWQDTAAYVRDIVEEAGLEIYQCHTSLVHGPKDWPEIIDLDEKQLVFAGAIGAKYAVVHPICPITINDPLFQKDYDTAMELNLKMYRRLLPVAKDAGVIICTENLFADGARGEGVTCFTSHAEELNQMMDQLPGLTICMDIGHAAITGQDPAEMVHALGSRLTALHLHSNDHIYDLHMPPFERAGMGWEAFCKALKDVNYQGTMNLETIFTVPNAPTEIQQDTYNYLHACAAHLAALVENS